MKKTLIYLAMAALLAGCRGGSSGSLQRKDQQNYDVVQEGQASGVTSTINAPGEAVPPPVAMTGTNADTTSNFTLPGAMSTDTATQTGGTLAGSLQTAAPSYPSYPSNPRPVRPRVEHPTRPPETATTEPASPAPTTTSVEGPPPATTHGETHPPKTDTQPSTDTQPPPSDTQPPPTTTTTSL
jgi:hypothetical protein